MTPAALVARWERKLARDGLAPLDQHIRGRIVIRTEIIRPRRQYLPDPERLAVALDDWRRGYRDGFTPAGLSLLAGAKGGFSRRWPDWWGCRATIAHHRARTLAVICRKLSTGMTLHEATRGGKLDDMARRYLRPLFSALAESAALGDDDEHRADERGD